MADETSKSILEYWFSQNPAEALFDPKRSQLWWSKKPETDQYIRGRFEATVHAAANGNLESWLGSARGRLALIILTDQFPRNMYRGTPDAFRFDSLALSWCLRGIDLGADRQLTPAERVFFYLPLEHAESMTEQEKCVSLHLELVASVGEKDKPAFFDFLKYAVRHREIIQRFGRFPHRNKILGRESSDEELAFLEQPGSSF